jgi:hypothetical protein
MGAIVSTILGIMAFPFVFVLTQKKVRQTKFIMNYRIPLLILFIIAWCLLLEVAGLSEGPGAPDGIWTQIAICFEILFTVLILLFTVLLFCKPLF